MTEQYRTVYLYISMLRLIDGSFILTSGICYLSLPQID
jgi:hypothetical protein